MSEHAHGEATPAEIDSCPGCGANWNVEPSPRAFTIRLRFVGVQLCQECVRAILPAARSFAMEDHGSR